MDADAQEYWPKSAVPVISHAEPAENRRGPRTILDEENPDGGLFAHDYSMLKQPSGTLLFLCGARSVKLPGHFRGRVFRPEPTKRMGGFEGHPNQQ